MKTWNSIGLLVLGGGLLLSLSVVALAWLPTGPSPEPHHLVADVVEADDVRLRSAIPATNRLPDREIRHIRYGEAFEEIGPVELDAFGRKWFHVRALMDEAEGFVFGGGPINGDVKPPYLTSRSSRIPTATPVGTLFLTRISESLQGLDPVMTMVTLFVTIFAVLMTAVVAWQTMSNTRGSGRVIDTLWRKVDEAIASISKLTQRFDELKREFDDHRKTQEWRWDFEGRRRQDPAEEAQKESESSQRPS